MITVNGSTPGSRSQRNINVSYEIDSARGDVDGRDLMLHIPVLNSDGVAVRVNAAELVSAIMREMTSTAQNLNEGCLQLKMQLESK